VTPTQRSIHSGRRREREKEREERKEKRDKEKEERAKRTSKDVVASNSSHFSVERHFREEMFSQWGVSMAMSLAD
jgi:hypothetical protein